MLYLRIDTTPHFHNRHHIGGRKALRLKIDNRNPHDVVNWVIWSNFAAFNERLCKGWHDMFHHVVPQWNGLCLQKLMLLTLHILQPQGLDGASSNIAITASTLRNTTNTVNVKCQVSISKLRNTATCITNTNAPTFHDECDDNDYNYYDSDIGNNQDFLMMVAVTMTVGDGDGGNGECDDSDIMPQHSKNSDSSKTHQNTVLKMLTFMGIKILSQD